MLETIQERREVDGVNDEQMLKRLWVFLECTALNSLRIHKNQWDTYEKTAKGSAEKYRDTSYSEKIGDQIRARLQKDDEPIDDYMEALLLMYNRLTFQPSDRVKIDRLYLNMRSKFYRLMRPYIEYSLEKFTRMASEFEKAFAAAK